MGLDCIILTPLNLINTKLTLPQFYPPLKTTNHILVDVKLKKQIDIGTYKKIGRVSVQDYQDIITKNQIINIKVTSDDISRSESIYGPRVAILKEKKFVKDDNIYKMCHTSHCPACY